MSTKFLDDAIEILNGTLLEVEIALRRLRLRVPAKVPLNPGSLAWEKYGDAWRLMYRAENSEPQLLVNASRDVRLRAVEQLTALREALFDATDEKLLAIERATLAARTFIDETNEMCENDEEKAQG